MPVWLKNRGHLQQQIHQRVRANLEALDLALASNRTVDRLLVEGGWYAILRIPSLTTGEDTAIHLLESVGVIVHPGEFFGMSGAGRLILSLLAPPSKFYEAIQQLFSGLTLLEK